MDILTDMLGQTKITLVPGKEKNLHPGGHKYIFLNQFSGDILFSSLASFVSLILVFCLFVCLFDVF